MVQGFVVLQDCLFDEPTGTSARLLLPCKQEWERKHPVWAGQGVFDEEDFGVPALEKARALAAHIRQSSFDIRPNF